MSIENATDGAVLLEQTGPVATMTLSRPATLNALTWSMYQQMEEHLESLATDESVCVVIIRGAGEALEKRKPVWRGE